MKITLQIKGQEKSFSEEELVTIIEEHSRIVTKAEVAKTPTEGKWFEVKPQEINQNLFQEKREDEKQEKTRERILKAFEKLNENPNQYGKNFKTMIASKESVKKCKTARGDMRREACKLGDRMADGVEQSLEWAQRISNGESWEDICNKADKSDWYRLVIWDGMVRRVGGSKRRDRAQPDSIRTSEFGDCDLPASNVDGIHYNDIYCVPLVVRYEE